MIPKIGIMQGRLSPPQDGRFQFSPKNWQAEFSLAKELGFDSIEWIFDEDENSQKSNWEFNPIIYRRYRDEIRKLSSRYNIGVHSVCVDYFMNGGLLSNNEAGVSVLSALIHVAKSIGIKTIILPFLEKAAVENQEQEKNVIKNINAALKMCELYGIKLALETELNAQDLKKFIKKFNSPYVGVCYDLGNTASYGHNSPRDIQLLDNLIFEVHIKDRKVGSSQSVYLGEGDVEFTNCFIALKIIGFNGPIILQANRGEDYLGDAKRQLEFVKVRMDEVWEYD